MSRSINIEAKEGFLPWRAQPSPETTIAELEGAVSLLKLDIVRTRADEILIVQTEEAIRDGVPAPTGDELAAAMFGADNTATVIEESGIHQCLDQEAFERHVEQDLDLGNLDQDSA